MAWEAEKAAAGQRIGELYQITRKLYGKRRNTNMPVRDKHGKLITSEQQIQKRWNEHFEEVLNRPEPTEVAEIPEAETDLEINTEKPSKIEIIKALRRGPTIACYLHGYPLSETRIFLDPK